MFFFLLSHYPQSCKLVMKWLAEKETIALL